MKKTSVVALFARRAGAVSGVGEVQPTPIPPCSIWSGRGADPVCSLAGKLLCISGFAISCVFVPAVARSGAEAGPPQAERVRKVASSEELEMAIETAQAGDRIILEDGRYKGLSLNALRGTEDRPIVITASNRRMAVIEGSCLGRNVMLSDCGYVYFDSLRFSGGGVWGVTLGPAYLGDSEIKGCQHIRFVDCEFDNAGQSLMNIGGDSEGIMISDSDFHHSGMKVDANKPYAEGIYIGNGASLMDRSHDITIRNNRFRDIGNQSNWGEAIDVKRQVYDVRIIGNTIENVVVNSDGAISVLMDPVDYPEGATNPNIVIEGNTILGVRKRPGGWNGAGISIGAKGIRIEGNIVGETAGPSLLIEANAANTSGLVRVYDNIFHGKITANAYGRGDQEVPLIIDYRNNWVGEEPVQEERFQVEWTSKATSDEFD